MKLWKALVGLFFALLIVDGALRKWVFPGLSGVLVLAKDLVLWGGFFVYIWQKNPVRLPRPVRGTWAALLIGAYIFVVLLQAFNLRQPSLIISAIGLKAHLAFMIPLVVLMPVIIAQTTERQVIRYMWKYTAVVFLPITVLGIYQYFQPPSSWINTYVGETEFVATVNGRPRITGTFSYIGTFTPYLKFSAYLGASVLLAGLQWKRKKITVLGTILLGGAFVTVPMTGSRGLVLLSAGGIIAIFLIARLGGVRRIRLAAVAAVVTAALFLQGGSLLQGWDDIAQRSESTGQEEASGRIKQVFATPIKGFEWAGFFGYGVGTNYKGVTRYVAQDDWEGRYKGDYGSLRLVAEIGFLGWLVLTAMKAALLYMAFQVVRRSQSPVAFIIGATAFSMLLSNIILTIVFRATRSALYWGSAGAMLGMWSLQKAHLEHVWAEQRAKVNW